MHVCFGRPLLHPTQKKEAARAGDAEPASTTWGKKNKSGLYSTLVFHKCFEQMFNSASPESLVGSGQWPPDVTEVYVVYGAEKPISSHLRSR